MTTTTAEDRTAIERARVAMNQERADAGQDTGFCVECGDEMTVVPTPTGGRLKHVNGRTDHAPRLWLVQDGRPVLPQPKAAEPTKPVGAVLPDEDGQEPAGVLPRQALTYPSSLVDALLDAATHHGVETVQNAETYRAAEQAAGMLQQILMPKQPEGGEPR